MQTAQVAQIQTTTSHESSHRLYAQEGVSHRVILDVLWMDYMAGKGSDILMVNPWLRSRIQFQA
jgi:hypothetical protein